MTRPLIYIFIFFLPVPVLFRQVHPTVKDIFYNLPFERSRTDLLEAIVNDPRFISKDTTFNNYTPNSFFIGNTTDKGLIKSSPDSIKILLAYGNTPLATEKGRQPSFKDVMLLCCQYFYSGKDSAEVEYGRLLNMLNPLFTDSASIKNEATYPKGTEKTIGKIFESFEPYTVLQYQRKL
jgi:hypothetical protein